MPSDAARSPRFAACACPFTRRISIALSRSPPDSWSAALQSIIPAPVRSRSAFTSFAEMVVLIANRSSSGSKVRRSRGARGRGRRAGGLVGRESGPLGLALGPLLGLALRLLLRLAPGLRLGLAPLRLLALEARLLLLGAELLAARPATSAIASITTLQERIASSLPGIT